MYIDKILWLISWPAMITLSYFLVLQTLKFLDVQIKNDPEVDENNPDFLNPGNSKPVDTD
jgi:hypothetical protein